MACVCLPNPVYGLWFPACRIDESPFIPPVSVCWFVFLLFVLLPSEERLGPCCFPMHDCSRPAPQTFLGAGKHFSQRSLHGEAASGVSML